MHHFELILISRYQFFLCILTLDFFQLYYYYFYLLFVLSHLNFAGSCLNLTVLRLLTTNTIYSFNFSNDPPHLYLSNRFPFSIIFNHFPQPHFHLETLI